ncbi:RagB/SusD family nutrient uptake outer membrane protein [Muricauda sp. 334s03]|uniref:RagB/SusD family nutrient uptake outer membrane protein n=1 Tax=Flagellimonas yonaguniensis TaxID=3031325 RepID=A0ABT5Y441_9FLAO|nr:RagB/SusD family nutrient uptake outer membrane protein [[Muricauda] yonaguniensis]MDF0718109.1 RagB/SusD family nutrient uptake outer membrane protein [[Muricauda] yonaguniensis]
MNNNSIMYRLVLAMIAILAFQSCSDKFEDIEGQLNADDLDYTATEDMVQALVGSYYIMATRGWEEPILLSVRGDDVNPGGVGDAQDGLTDTDLFIYNQGYWMYNSLWNIHYGDIVSLNTEIELIENFKEFATVEDQVTADQYIAEIKVMRAWLHFNLARVWGDVFIIETTQPDAEIMDGTTSKDEMMQYIADQMDEVILLLPNMRPNERTDIPGGITRYTAYALKAMAYMELEDYQGMADACAAIINSNRFSLYPDFYSLFKKPGELSDESLMELQFSDYGSSTSDEFYHLYDPFGPVGWTPARANASGGWGFYEPSIKFIKFMLDRGDLERLETSVLFSPRGVEEVASDPNYTDLPSFMDIATSDNRSYVTTRDGDQVNDYARALFASGKHYLPSVQLTDGRNNYGGGKNMIVIRYAEILLMYAEALTRGASGSGMTADQAVNLVRSRAGMPSLSGVTSEDVMDEKFAELGMEWGIRYYDMLRLENYSELSYDGRTFTADKAYLPYPQEQLDALPTLGGGSEDQ